MAPVKDNVSSTTEQGGKTVNTVSKSEGQDEFTSGAETPNSMDEPALDIDDKATDASTEKTDEVDNVEAPKLARKEKKGLSVKDRKLIKKYGSLEAAEAAEVNWTCMPCEEEVRVHNLTHLPFRDWCPYCVQGRGISAPHRKGAADEAGMPFYINGLHGDG